jgi:large subunit ribosomal protein L17
MAQLKKLGRTSSSGRRALLRGQVTDLFWYGKLETTNERAKAVKAVAEKLVTLAIKAHSAEVEVEKTVVDAAGKKTKQKVKQDSAKKLNARRKIMAYVYDKPELRLPKEKIGDFKNRTDINHPIVEKIFNIYAPKYEARAKELGQGGGYLRIVRKTVRKGDGGEVVELQWV